MSITNYQARKVTHCHINLTVYYWPIEANQNCAVYEAVAEKANERNVKRPKLT